RAWHRPQSARARSCLRLVIDRDEAALLVALNTCHPRCRAGLLDRRRFVQETRGACDLRGELGRHDRHLANGFINAFAHEWHHAVGEHSDLIVIHYAFLSACVNFCVSAAILSASGANRTMRNVGANSKYAVIPRATNLRAASGLLQFSKSAIL